MGSASVGPRRERGTDSGPAPLEYGRASVDEIRQYRPVSDTGFYRGGGLLRAETPALDISPPSVAGPYAPLGRLRHRTTRAGHWCTGVAIGDEFRASAQPEHIERYW